MHYRNVPHTTNQRAFRDCDINEPFFRLYTLLVAIELALKDRLAAYVQTHELAVLVPRALPTISAGLQTELTNLDAALRALVCTYRGSAAPVNPAKYPDIRYIRHEKDGFVGDTTDAALVLALRHTHQLVEELRREGVTL